MNYPKKPLSHYHPIMFFMLKSTETILAWRKTSLLLGIMFMN